MDNDISISKRKLWQYVNKKINRIIHHYHVLSVITILFDEMLIDLKNGKEIKIYNFGTLVLKKLKPRKYFNLIHKSVMVSTGYKILRFTMAKPIKKKILSRLAKIKKED